MSKFKNTEELEKAYKELEKEFTKKSQKLAEVEKTNYVTLLHNEMDSLLNDYAKKRISDLKAKLAESEKKLQENKIGCFNTQEALFKKIKKLEQQLADTEAQNKRVLEKLELIVSANQELEKENQQLKEELEKPTQDKISFALEQLEKINKHIFNEGFKRNKHYGEITSFVCDLIKAIKEME